MKPYRSELPFASFLAYSPRGDTKEIRSARSFMRLLKENRSVATGETASAIVARRIRERGEPWASSFLGTDTALVPVPRSGLPRPGALWPANEIVMSLGAEGFGRRVVACLKRVNAVPKAATSRSEERPKAHTHFESLELLEPLSLPPRITLVDDVVTRGAQLLGAAWRIWSERPDIEVRALAVIRTVSDPEDFVGLDAPCTGRIEWRDGGCYRQP